MSPASDGGGRLPLLLLVIGAGVLLYVLRDLAQLVLIAALGAYVLNPLVARLQRRTDWTTATLLVIGGVVALGTGTIVVLGPLLQREVAALRAGVDPQAVLNVVEQVDRRLTAALSPLGGGEVDLSAQLRRRIDGLGGRLVQSLPALLGTAANILLVPFIAVFLLRDGPRMKRGLIRLVPNRYFEFSLEAIYKVDQQLGNYFRGLVLEVLVVTALAVGAFWLLGVASFVLLGLLTGITTIIPYVGSLLGGGIAVLVHLSSTGRPSAAALVLLAVLALQVLDETVIQPLVFARAVNLHPLEVLMAVWVGAQALGAIGMVVAIPVAGAAKVVFTRGLALIQQYQFR